MTDPSLTPEQEQAVRRALRELRPTGPPPPDVVARLETTLADLTADRRDGADAAAADTPEGETATVAPVVPLATRRRRWAGAALVAAAAVVVAGVGLGPLVDSWQGGDAGGDDSTAATSLDEEADAGADAVEESGPADLDARDGNGLFSAEDRPQSGVPQSASIGVPRIRPAHFERDVAAVRDLPVELLSAGVAELDSGLTFDRQAESEPGTRSRSGKTFSMGAGCGPEAGDGERSVAVSYRRQPATLLFRAPEGDSQVVELHLCRDVGPERVTTLTVR